MSLCQLHWSSGVLGKQTSAFVILPDGPGPFATYYLLHGLSDDHTMWLRRTRVELYAARYPLIVVMPDGYRGYYTDNASGPAYAKHMGEELTGFIERTFPAKKTRDGRCVGGLSMGGYGALRVALGYPHLFASANSHSGALMQGQKQWTNPDQEFQRQIFGPNPAGSNHDLLALARKAAGQLPKLRIDCGTEDFLLEDNRAFHRALTDAKLGHEYEEFPGGHEWGYWDTHVQEALAFHARNLGLV